MTLPGDNEDPFVQFLHPPVNETPEAKAERLRQQQEAENRSRAIDEELMETKRRLDRKRKALKILLLGQAESGKTSLLKNFQLCFSPSQFQTERLAWKYVIHLNIITSLKKVVKILEHEWETTSNPLHFPSSPHSPTDLRRVVLSLQSLLALEDDLLTVITSSHSHSNTPSVPSGGGWKRFLGGQRTSTSSIQEHNPWNSVSIKEDDSTHILAACREDIITLWRSPVVAHILREQGVNLKLDPGFFLDDVHRIGRHDYMPSDADVVKARIRTMGVEEHNLIIERDGPDNGKELFIVDVGGSRTMRSVWASYFTDYNAILFLAPLAFDRMLEEDPRVNRLEDSLILWKGLCSNKLLADSALIVIFNKKDILESVLADGVQVVTFVPSYADRPNDAVHVTKYFREKFGLYHKKLSPKRRQFVSYECNAIDIHSTATLLMGVHEGILRKQLERSEIL